MSQPSEKAEPYPLAPETPAPPPAGKANIDKPSVLEGFEDDADFSKDPEVEAALKAKPMAGGAARPAPADPAASGPPFIRPGFGDERVWGGIGLALMITTLIAVAVTSRMPMVPTIAAVVLMLYKVVVHTATGVAAVWIAALLSEQRLGKVELAAARMFAAVSAVALFFSVRISIFGDSPVERNIWSAVFGALAYLGLVAGLFRIWGHKLIFVIGSHLGLWLLMQVGLMLHGYLSSVHAAAAAGAP